MSTRKLILTALVCGLAIMIAGGVKLFQVARDDAKVEVLAFGTTVQVADMTVSVEAVKVTQSATFVTVTMFGVENADAFEGWRLLTGGEVLAPVVGDDPLPGLNLCTVTRIDGGAPCTVVFPPSTGSVTVAYLRGGAQSQWSEGSQP